MQEISEQCAAANYEQLRTAYIVPGKALPAHDPEKWEPVSRLREAGSPCCGFAQCFGGRRQVG
jgi:hypothetical protein